MTQPTSPNQDNPTNVKHYRKKPVVIEAVQLSHQNTEEVMKWCGGTYYSTPPMRAVTGITIKTLEGDHAGLFDDYIIKGVKGEFYPCKPDIFEATYEAVDPHQQIDSQTNHQPESKLAQNAQPSSNGLEEILDWLAEDYIELEDPEAADMWKLDKKAAIKKIQAYTAEAVAKELEALTTTELDVTDVERFEYQNDGLPMLVIDVKQVERRIAALRKEGTSHG